MLTIREFIQTNPVIFGNKRFTKALDKVFGDDLSKHTVQFTSDVHLTSEIECFHIIYDSKDEGNIRFQICHNRVGDGEPFPELIEVYLCFKYNGRNNFQHGFQIQYIPYNATQKIMTAALRQLFKIHSEMTNIRRAQAQIHNYLEKFHKLVD
jgi:hypothetical protein